MANLQQKCNLYEMPIYNYIQLMKQTSYANSYQGIFVIHSACITHYQLITSFTNRIL